MLVKYATLEYFQKYADAINNDELVKKSGLSATSLYGFTDLNKAFLMTYKDGKIIEVKEAKLDEKAEFITSADYKLMAGIAKGEIDGREAKPKYPMMKAMKNMKALQRIAELAKNMKDVEY